MNDDLQLTFADVDPEYKAFVDKFKPKKTTDDCYTPEKIYDAVAGWVEDEYKIPRSTFVRPFFPGGDYERFDYPDGCVVVDNPPFSIRTEIVRFYQRHGIRSFIFAPALTLLSDARIESVCHIAVGFEIVYENGAKIATSFETNLEDCVLRTAPELYRRLKEAQEPEKQYQAVYEYPDNVITAAMAQRLCKYGVDFKIGEREAIFISELDAQKSHKKTIFGGGLLVSGKAAAEKAAAEKAAAEKAAAEKAAAERKRIWKLSEREKEIVRRLGTE